MKKIFVFLLFLLPIIQLFGQSQGVTYQAIIIDTKKVSGIGNQKNYLPNREMIVRFTIYNDLGAIDYQEEHVTSTDANGIINLVIGKGTPTASCPLFTRETFYDVNPSTVETSRTFREISWSGKAKNLKVEICIDRFLMNFANLNQQALYFIPYAYHRNITAIGTMDIEGVTNLNSALNVRRKSATNLSGTLDVTHQSTLNDTLTVNAISQLNGQTSIKTTLDGDASDLAAYPLTIEGSNHGLSIKVNGSRNGDNSFMGFFDQSGMQGQITGQTLSEAAQDPEFIYTNVLYAAKVIVMAVNIVVAGATFWEVSNLTGDIADAVFLAAEIIGYNVFALTNLGVSYSSGSGDYAEWLPKMNENEMIQFGEVVGVFGGKITKITQGAEQILVVSNAPVVLGNLPSQKSDLEKGEKVGFMGQVPVWVIGKVKQGDYIVAYQSGSGLAVAISPENLTLEMSSKIIGKAWQTNNSEDKKLVRTLIGIKSDEWIKFAQENQNQIESLDANIKMLNQRINKRNEALQQLIPAYKEVLKKKQVMNQKTSLIN